jgi:P-type Mg2+ transporter
MVGPTSPNGSYSRGRVCAATKRKLKIPPLFHAGWFVESLLTQTLIIHIIRTTKIPFIESRASSALVVTTVIICAVGMSLPFTWAGAALGFAPLPRLYWPLVAVMLVTYATLTHVMNVWFTRRVGL